ncbi:ATP-binding cassette domain-containing protein [Nocardioides sp. zg-1228]|uniref:ATP-binding cassette domain-containing protein n=2 Tax=Nocardioides sp. zg-1228 TaxID=2763008 RepID=UPI0032168989
MLGRPYRDLHNPGRQVGVMLDASAQHPGRTGREVLRVAAISLGVSKARVEEALALVGLTDEEAGRRVRNYSLGMRQRLGLAAALLGEPQVLVLDEPANGLDPQGIHWMRGLLRRFADGGGTVLLSSHLLHEVQVVADDLVMIGRGRIVAMGSKDELLRRGGTSVTSTDDDRLARLLQDNGVDVTRTGAGLVVDAEPRVVGEIAARESVVLLELRSGGSDGLEEMFLDLTAATSREGDAA